jgi:hypothetical protein
LALTTVCWDAVAGTPQPAESGKAEASPSAASVKPTPAAPKVAPVAVKADQEQSQEIQTLKQLLAAQQQQIEQLRVALDEQKQLIERALETKNGGEAPTANLGQVASLNPVLPPAAKSAGPSGGPNPNPLPASPGQDQAQQKKVDALEKTVSSINKGLGNFSLSGDVRVRYETFIQDGTETRNRQRLRARLNLTGKISDDMYGGISFGSGELNDPISTNQTETAFYIRKPFYLDKAYLTINPKAFRALSLTGGKQAYPWYRTELTWDNDLNPEGFSQKLSLNSKSFIKNVTIVGFQLPFNEVSSGPDSFTYGGQLQVKFNAGEKGTFEIYGGGMKFSHPDPIAVAQGKTILANSLTNTVVKDANGNVTGYAGEFLYVTASVRAGYKVAPKWPFDVGFDFVQNTQAATDQRKGLMAEANFGQEVNPKDVKFGYKYYHIQKDAVISAFNFSDLRTPTNGENHVFFIGYQIIKNVSGEWTYLLGKRLNDPLDKWLSRMQFDLVYKF